MQCRLLALECRTSLRMAEQLPEAIRHGLPEGDEVTRIQYANVAFYKQYFGATARWYREAFAIEPGLARDLESSYRYTAALAAAKVGCGQSKDAASFDDTARAQWRKQAISWLRGDLGICAQLVQSGRPREVQVARRTLLEMKRTPWLASLREPDALLKLPNDEVKPCLALWVDVEALLARTKSPSTPAVPAKPGAR